MGTGKTHSISENNFNNIGNVLYISVRITFTQSIASKYNMTSYLDAKKNKIPMEFSEQHKKWVIQIDSLPSFKDICNADLIVLDEFESLLDQLSCCGNCNDVYSSLIKLLNSGKTIIIMDALL